MDSERRISMIKLTTKRVTSIKGVSVFDGETWTTYTFETPVSGETGSLL
jgi:hypothetical protein